jgi:uncharacterized protein involved in cysteine biosynthesis
MIFWIGVSIIINIFTLILIIGLVFFTGNSLYSFLENLFSIDFFTAVDIVFDILFIIVGIYLTTILFSTISSIFNSPAYDQITELVLDRIGVDDYNTNYGRWDFFIQMFISLKFEIKKIFLTIILFLLSVVVNILPGIGQLFSALFTYLSIILLNGMDILDPALDRQIDKFRNKVKFIIKNPGIWPFIFISSNLNAIPVLNIITIPISIIISAQLFVFIHKEK